MTQKNRTSCALNSSDPSSFVITSPTLIPESSAGDPLETYQANKELLHQQQINKYGTTNSRPQLPLHQHT
jgi:hypothetical protein